VPCRRISLPLVLKVAWMHVRSRQLDKRPPSELPPVLYLGPRTFVLFFVFFPLQASVLAVGCVVFSILISSLVSYSLLKLIS
jgi:hypothetical protein